MICFPYCYGWLDVDILYQSRNKIAINLVVTLYSTEKQSPSHTNRKMMVTVFLGGKSCSFDWFHGTWETITADVYCNMLTRGSKTNDAEKRRNTPSSKRTFSHCCQNQGQNVRFSLGTSNCSVSTLYLATTSQHNNLSVPTVLKPSRNSKTPSGGQLLFRRVKEAGTSLWKMLTSERRSCFVQFLLSDWRCCFYLIRKNLIWMTFDSSAPRFDSDWYISISKNHLSFHILSTILFFFSFRAIDGFILNTNSANIRCWIVKEYFHQSYTVILTMFWLIKSSKPLDTHNKHSFLLLDDD